jgi:hypothetical protein
MQFMVRVNTRRESNISNCHSNSINSINSSGSSSGNIHYSI